MDSPSLKTPLHLRYWQRCLRTLLPHHYTPNDSQRMTLGFFIIVAIDLLSTSSSSSSSTPSKSSTAPTTTTTTKPILTPTDRRNLRQWVLSCQHPQGGFCGSPTHVFPPQHQEAGMGNANIAATYFALLLLPMLVDDDDSSAAGTFAGVHRIATLRWLRRLQRSEDGSFGEVVYDLPGSPCTGQGEAKRTTVVGGGKDMRYCYLAATIRWILRGDGSGDAGGEQEEEKEDIDVAALVAHIQRSQTYDGGFSESFRHESHAGYAYCAVAALALLDRPAEGAVAEAEAEAGQEKTPDYKTSRALQDGISDIPAFISFLVSRQFMHMNTDAAGNNNEDDDGDDDPDCANFQLADLSLAGSSEATRHVGFNGRCNKVADTCYTWWVLGSLSVLGVLNGNGNGDGNGGGDGTSNTNNNTVVDPVALRAQRDFLLEKTQHAIGGFGKRPGDPPDIYHSSLGLAALATMRYPGLKGFDPGLCVSVDTVRKIEMGRRALLGRPRGGGGGGAGAGAGAGAGGTRVGFGKGLVDMALSMRGGERPEWLEF